MKRKRENSLSGGHSIIPRSPRETTVGVWDEDRKIGEDFVMLTVNGWRIQHLSKQDVKQHDRVKQKKEIEAIFFQGGKSLSKIDFCEQDRWRVFVPFLQFSLVIYLHFFFETPEEKFISVLIKSLPSFFLIQIKWGARFERIFFRTLLTTVPEFRSAVPSGNCRSLPQPRAHK